MFCPYCGKENRDDAQFCFSCGKSIVISAEPKSPKPAIVETKTSEPKKIKRESIDFSVFKAATVNDALIQAALMTVIGILLFVFQFASLGITVAVLILIINVLIGFRGFKNISEKKISNILFILWTIYAVTFFLSVALGRASNSYVLMVGSIVFILSLIALVLFSIFIRSIDSKKIIYNIAAGSGVLYSALMIFQLIFQFISFPRVVLVLNEICSIIILGLYCSFLAIFVSHSKYKEELKKLVRSIIPERFVTSTGFSIAAFVLGFFVLVFSFNFSSLFIILLCFLAVIVSVKSIIVKNNILSKVSVIVSICVLLFGSIYYIIRPGDTSVGNINLCMPNILSYGKSKYYNSNIVNNIRVFYKSFTKRTADDVVDDMKMVVEQQIYLIAVFIDNIQGLDPERDLNRYKEIVLDTQKKLNICYQLLEVYTAELQDRLKKGEIKDDYVNSSEMKELREIVESRNKLMANYNRLISMIGLLSDLKSLLQMNPLISALGQCGTGNSANNTGAGNADQTADCLKCCYERQSVNLNGCYKYRVSRGETSTEGCQDFHQSQFNACADSCKSSGTCNTVLYIY